MENCNQIIRNEEKFEITEDKNIHDYNVDGNKAVQIKPQKIKLQLVKGKFKNLCDSYLYLILLILIF